MDQDQTSNRVALNQQHQDPFEFVFFIEKCSIDNNPRYAEWIKPGDGDNVADVVLQFYIIIGSLGVGIVVGHQPALEMARGKNLNHGYAPKLFRSWQRDRTETARRIRFVSGHHRLAVRSERNTQKQGQSEYGDKVFESCFHGSSQFGPRVHGILPRASASPVPALTLAQATFTLGKLKS